MTRRTVAWLLALEVTLLALTLVVALDMEVHRNVEQRQGTNTWGYRGMSRFTLSGRARVAVLGGSAAYGFNVEWANTFPFYLERRLNQLRRAKYPGFFTEVVNLSAMGDGAASYVTTLQDYAYLKPTAVLVYDGFAAATANDSASTRHDSFVFRRAGYLPILTDVASGRRRWTEGAVVDALLRDDPPGAPGDVTCGGGSRTWCAAMLDTVAWSVEHGLPVMVVTPPYISRRHEAQQRSLAEAIQARFAADRRVRYVNVGRQVDVHDPTQSFDGAHLTARGNEIVAENLVDHVFDLVSGR